MTINKHLVQQLAQKHTVNTSYGKISVTSNQLKNQTPNMRNGKKTFQNDGVFEMNGSKSMKQKKTGQKQGKMKELPLKINMRASDNRYDQFESYMDLPILWGTLQEHIDDETSAIAAKRQQRKAQMNKRREKLPEKGAAAPKLKNGKPRQNDPPQNRLAQPAGSGKNNGKSRISKSMTGSSIPQKQSSTNDQKRAKNLSPTISSQKKKAHGDKVPHIGLKKISSYRSNSEFTLSSIGKEENRNDSNSIISEEDSAFADCTPAQKNATKKKSLPQGGENFGSAAEINVVKDGLLGIQGNARNANFTIASSQQQHALDAKVVTRQKTTIGGKSKISSRRAPIQRSPTHKSRNQQSDNDSKSRLKVQKVPQTYQQQKSRGGKGMTGAGDGRHSRNSSLNLPSENQTDVLSLNFGIGRFRNGGRKQSVSKFGDTLSVQSVITKGGTVINPMNIHKEKDKSKNNTRSLSRVDDSLQQMITLRKTKVDSGEVSKFNFRIQDEEFDEEIDLKVSRHKAKIQMMQVYLKTPYKVLTISEIKQKEKENYSPLKLFRAENNLAVHTNLRSDHQLAPKAAVNKAGIRNIGEEANSLLKSGGYTLVNVNKGQKNQKKVQQPSENQNDRDQSPTSNENLMCVNDEERSTQNLVHVSSGDNLQSNLPSYKLKQLKQQKQDLEHNFKQVFYDQLETQLTKRIETVKNQGNLLKKQKDLFNCYGPTYNFTSTVQSGADLMKITSNYSGFDTTQGNGHHARWMGNTNQTFNISEDGGNGKKPNPYSSTKQKNLRESQHVRDSQTSANQNELLKQTSAEVLAQSKDQLNDESGNVTIDDEGETLKNLLIMSQSIGFSKKQMDKLQKYQHTLSRVEKSLERHQQRTGKAQKPTQVATGSFALKEQAKKAYGETQRNSNDQQAGKKISFYNQKKSIPKAGIVTPMSKTQPSELEDNMQSFSILRTEDSGSSPAQRLHQHKRNGSQHNNASQLKTTHIENGNVIEVKDYFSNKINLRRSVENKLHYDSRAQNQKNTLRKQQLEEELQKAYRKGGKYPDNRTLRTKNYMESIQQAQNEDYENQDTVHGVRTHTKNNKTMVDVDTPGTLLPVIKSNLSSTKNKTNKKQHMPNETGRSNGYPDIMAKSGGKNAFFFQSPEHKFYPLKKSGTLDDKNEKRQPIRQQKDNVIMAYAAMHKQSKGTAGASITDRKQRQQLSYQFTNISPKLMHYSPQHYGTARMRDEYDQYNENNQIIASSGFKNQYASKFATAKQSMMLKGVLNQTRNSGVKTLGKTMSSRKNSVSNNPEVNTVELINNYASRPQRIDNLNQLSHDNIHEDGEQNTVLPDITNGGLVYSPVPGQ